MDAFFEALRSIRLVDIVDIGFVSVLLWLLILWFRTTRARAALIGLGMLGGVFLVANQFDLQLTSWILQGFFAALVLVIVVVFQEDIRRFFEQLSRIGRAAPQHGATDSIDHLVRALSRLAQDHRGALLVFPGVDDLERHLDGGIDIDAKVSEPLLLSLFDPHSPGHDGAILIHGDRIARFAVHLPLSTDHAQLGQRGTRHAAALGLSERSDALCLTVSEERGTVSVSRAGVLTTLERPALAATALREFLAANDSAEDTRGGWRRQLSHSSELVMAAVAATLFWVLAVPLSGPIEVERSVAVELLDLPADWALETITPPAITVVVSGSRRDVLLLGDEDMRLQVNAVLAELGRRTFSIAPEQVSVPPNIKVRSVSPETIKLSLTPSADR